MITKSIQTISGKVRINIPTSLTEITIGQMIKMESADGNEIPLIPQLTEDVVNNITNYQDLIDIRERVLSLAHKIKYEYKESKLPEFIVFGTKRTRFGFIKENRIKVPKNLSIQPAGAYLACRDLIADEINRHINLYGEDGWQNNFVPSLKTCAMILAHYFYCPVTGQSWSDQKAEAFESEILKLSVQEALPVARFFIKAFPNLSQLKIGLWKTILQSWRNVRASRRIKNLNISQL
jgi:hypothetical protein